MRTTAIVLLLVVVMTGIIVQRLRREFGPWRGRSFEYWLEKADLPDAKSRREGLGALMDALRDDNLEMRQKAVTSLYRLGVPPGEALAELREAMLSEQDADIRCALALVLEKIGTKAVPVLLEGLADPDQKVRDHFTYALARMKPDSSAVPVLLKALGAEQSRGVAVITLANMGEKAKEAVPALEKLLTEKDLRFRAQVAWAIWSINQDDEKAVPILREMVSQGDEWDRISAIRWLAEIGAKAKPAIPALIKALHDDSDLVRAEAAKALGQMGRQAKEATGALRQLLADEDITVREKAAEALAHIEGKSENSH